MLSPCIVNRLRTLHSRRAIGTILPIIAAGNKAGDELRLKRADKIRKIFIKDNHIVGFQLAKDIRGAGVYRTLMNKMVNIKPFKEQLLEPRYGMNILINQDIYNNLIHQE